MCDIEKLNDGVIIPNPPPPFLFGLVIKVRDYETDSQGIVNNANYLHYLEMTRHAFCEWRGYSFSQMSNDGIVAVMRKIEMEYLRSLHGGELFISYVNVEREGPRFMFHQSLYSLDGKLIVKARATIVATHDGRLTKGDELASRLNVN